MHRRNFLATPLAAWQLAGAEPEPATDAEPHVYAIGDGLRFTTAEYAALLAKLAAGDAVARDDYSRGGNVEALETRMAALLGKEAAVWLPTGTMANHLAVRMLAGDRRRVLVQADSHLYNDCGDCAQTLSNLTLIPLAPGRATFTLEDVQRAAADAAGGRVLTPIGALQIETPVRRHQGERFDFDQMQKIAAWARTNHVGLHLDGARIFLESVYTGRPIKQYAALFDTVYVSMYKYFNSAAGAILAGPKTLLADLYHTRRMFGGGLPHVWPYTAVAHHYLEGFEQRFRTGVETSERVIAELSHDANFQIERVPSGTNIFRLRVVNGNASGFQQRLLAAGITAPNPEGDWFAMQVNETWGNMPAGTIVARIRNARG
ncbi:MAG TPA: beta-eliminating lyase-related protein [Candidatus Acidoferrum sp.]|nr:beta-eliminating lyase-related protein [Candidatus Acidoferrum sp.]